MLKIKLGDEGDEKENRTNSDKSKDNCEEFGKIMSGNQVTKTNGGQGHGGKIKGINKAPVLHEHVGNCANGFNQGDESKGSQNDDVWLQRGNGRHFWSLFLGK